VSEIGSGSSATSSTSRPSCPRAVRPRRCSRADLILPASGEQDLVSWAAVTFVASYSSPGTRQAYAPQVRLWFDWCAQRHLETRGLAPATVALGLVVITGFYRYYTEEQLLEHSLAVQVRRPKVSQET
jgi:hypothetical protein